MLKKFILLLLVVMTLSACAENNAGPPQPTKSPEEVEKALSGLIEERDEVYNTSFYYAQTTIENRGKSDFYIYFRKENGIVSDLQFEVNYVGRTQIDINWLTIRADDQLFDINNINDYITSRSSYSTVWENYNDIVGRDELKMIKAMANAEKTIVRCTGTDLYSTDIVLSKRQKQAMLNVFRAYMNAGGDTSNFGDEY